MTERNQNGMKLLKNGFQIADPNNNGICSLAELDSFIKIKLNSEYPKSKNHDTGQELYKFFKPCYVRAFYDAKDFKKDDGKVISGTENCTADDFVSKGEFRLFCAYLCIYAAMV